MGDSRPTSDFPALSNSAGTILVEVGDAIGSDELRLSFDAPVAASGWTASWVEISEDGVTWIPAQTRVQAGASAVTFGNTTNWPDLFVTPTFWRFTQAPAAVLAPQSGDTVQ